MARRMAGRVLGFVLVVVVGRGATADAAELQSTADRFRLDIAPEGAQVCVVFPKLPTLRCDDLAGVKPPSMRDLQDFVYVRRASGTYMLSHIIALAQAGGEVGRTMLVE